MENYMSLERAIVFMSTAKTVHEWNDLREQVKKLVNPATKRQILNVIDSDGLIVKVLKRNST